MKQIGLFKLKGTAEGYSFYESNGEMRIRKATGFTAERIKTDPNLARVRENNLEFGGAAMIGKFYRLSIAQVLDEMSDASLSNRMMRVARAIIGRATTGLRGQRPFLPLPAKDLLVGFPFNASVPLEDAFLAPYTVATNPGRAQVVVTVPDFNTTNLVHPPFGATHFRIVAACSVLSSYTYDSTTRQYLAADLAANGKNALAYSGYIPIGGNVGAATVVTAAITPAPTLLATSALVTCVGIDFFQLVAGNQYLMNGSTTMKIKEVY